uniref:Cyclin-dependent kinase inhibitor domain-containing protein n=1 Tax=Eptatretus burgeri TaxID=7764 RepID=A0A8C4QD44_EPTBU
MGSQRQSKKAVARSARPRSLLAQPGKPGVKTPVCRNLFGPVDHEASRADLRAQLQEIAERSRLRWNFDFQRDTSLEGRYAWEAVSVSVVPEWYKPVSCGVASSAETTPASEPVVFPKKPGFPERTSGSGRRDLTDFFEKRKRAASPFENTATCRRGMDELRPQPIAMH